MARPSDAEPAEEKEEEEEKEAANLPEGVRKEVLILADPAEMRGPRKGDECTVHYAGRMRGEDACFDDSRQRGAPISFRLGAREVIEGWDLAVATMKRGEVSRFSCAPEYAYGERGMPGKIPPDATLDFEIELLSWRSDADVLGDGSVLRTKVREGHGFDEVEDGTEVLISLQAKAADGMLLESFPLFEFTVGSAGLGLLSKAVSSALAEMRRGAKVALRCDSRYAAGYGDGTLAEAFLDLELLEVYESSDVSPGQDKSVRKKRVRSGEGCQFPADGAQVHLRVEAAADKVGAALPSFAGPAELRFAAGDGEVCDALEYAVPRMVAGERAVVTGSCKLLGDARLGLAEATPEGSEISLTVELLGFENGKPLWDMTPTEKINFAARRKEVGTWLFKAQRYGLALERYKMTADLLRSHAELPEGAAELFAACELNKAACMLKLEEYSGAKAACSTVLKDEPDNAKALFRRATALLAMRQQEDAIVDCKQWLKADPDNKEAKRLLNQCITSLREDKKKASAMFGLGHKAFSGFADEEEARARHAKEAHAEGIRRKGAEARAEAAGRPARNCQESLEDLARAQSSMDRMQRNIREMELDRLQAR